MLLHWIWLAERANVSSWEKQKLLQHFQDPEEIFYADRESFCHIEGFRPEAADALQNKDLAAARKILSDCEEKEIRILTIQDAQYPKRLKNIPDSPILLYYKGRIPELDDSPVIGVVGTREASVYGLQSAKRLGYQIGRCGGILVSGMAKGIDAMAMSGALTAGQKVVGVLGCGVDLVYPAQNQALFRDAEKYGCILSEYPPETPPHKWNFPRRNRIISGLSCGVLVVEAPKVSGALITARRAAEQGRDLFVVPGNIDVASCEGSNALLREGAISVTCGWDILSEYAHIFPGKVSRHMEPCIVSVYPEETAVPAENRENSGNKPEQNRSAAGKNKVSSKEIHKKVIDNLPSSPYSDVKDSLASLSADQQTVVDALQQGERLVDDIIQETGMTTGKILAILTMLELKGIIRRLPGKRIILN